jgi:manganese transport protein
MEKPKLTTPSLPEVHNSVGTVHTSWFRRLFAFAGPAYLVSVGYMDPGNWATDLEGGARFGYELLWVLVMSNAMAILLQTLSARLGIVSRKDLAQACREAYPKPVAMGLWALCEVAIAACDLAEVLGAAIALNLLFKIPLLIGVVLTAADTLMVLWLARFGIRKIEAIVLSLITIIGACFVIEVWLSKPVLSQVAMGLIPMLNDKSLYIAIGILGATVMPHNLYLHSALVQTRQIGVTTLDRKTACKFNFLDSVIALNAALLVNAAILIVAASVFHSRGIVVTEIQQAHLLLAPLLGTSVAGVAFAIALLASGQSSTLTGTMAGQIIMEGFLDFRMRPWLRRLITRMLAIVPAVLTIWIAGDKATYKLLILSQVILSMQLPFAVIPLIHFTSDKKRMGSFANKPWVRLLSWTTAAVIVALNIWLVYGGLMDGLEAAGGYRWLIEFVAFPLCFGLLLLLVWITFEPIFPNLLRRKDGETKLPATVARDLPTPLYKLILVPLDHSPRDRQAISHAAAMARQHSARLHLLHVEEGVTSQVYGTLASTSEIEQGEEYFQNIISSLQEQGIDVALTVVHSSRPSAAIARFAATLKPDLIVMGAHGHTGLQDIVRGDTINTVRHEVAAPILIVRNE